MDHGSKYQKYWMRKAVRLAWRGVGKTAPNPAVGCVLVKDGRVIGEGWHRMAGGPHAEIEALRDCSALDAAGADCFVTLEPCNHTGKTPPCTDALIHAGVRSVFIGMLDPNPGVTGGGARKLQTSGIQVVSGILEHKAQEVNEGWVKWVTTGLPFVTLKLAASLDGKIATASGESRWISCEKSRQFVHELRRRSSGIMVGKNTVAVDDPLLTARQKDRIVKTPLRIITDSNLALSLNHRIFRKDFPGKTMIFTVQPISEGKVKQFQDQGVEIRIVPANSHGRVELSSLMQILGKMQIESILVEGGGTLAADLVHCRLVDRLLYFMAPMLVGGVKAPSVFQGDGFGLLHDCPRVKDIRLKRFGDDYLFSGILDSLDRKQ